MLLDSFLINEIASVLPPKSQFIHCSSQISQAPEQGGIYGPVYILCPPEMEIPDRRCFWRLLEAPREIQPMAI
jgi:hypothetical protein